MFTNFFNNNAGGAEDFPKNGIANVISKSKPAQEKRYENIEKNIKVQDGTKKKRALVKKNKTIIIFIAADNDLAPFARRNLKQLLDLGSSPYMNIIVQLDTRITGNIKITRRYYIEKNKLIVMNQNDPHSQKMDSGAPETLIHFCQWAIKNFPAQDYVLILWNHGTGIIDIGRPRSINPLQLFSFNPSTNLIELDRSVSFLELLQDSQNERGICFDDSTGHYLTNQGLEYALRQIGQKFSCICFDACLMAMIEIANIVHDFAEFMVASQEVELASGHHYQKMLEPLLTRPIDKEPFAAHIVKAYEETYKTITQDYTQSALNLTSLKALEENISTISELLIESIKGQQGTSIKDAIKTSRHKLNCTHFNEPSYIDLSHFYQNLLLNIKNFQYKDRARGAIIKKALSERIAAGQILISKVVAANATGKNLSKARGLSIYFPERLIHNSYKNTNFANTNSWYAFLTHYLQAKRC